MLSVLRLIAEFLALVVCLLIVDQLVGIGNIITFLGLSWQVLLACVGILSAPWFLVMGFLFLTREKQ